MLFWIAKLAARDALAFLVHVLDRWLVNEQVGLAAAGELDAVLVVPLDVAVDLFAVLEHDDHRGLGLHLLLVIKILGVGLLGGSGLARRAVAALHGRSTVAVAGQAGPDELAVGELFALGS